MATPLFHDDFDYWESAVSIRLNKVFLFDQFKGSSKKSRITQPSSNKANGLVSDKAAKRVQKKVELLYDVARVKTIYSKSLNKSFRYKLGFLTLTLPSSQIHTDQEILKSCFQPFIREIRILREDFMYVWKAETQANGNLHFHVTTNSFLRKEFINARWNYWVNKLGYVDRYGKENPPSAKIQVCYGEDGLAMYMAKYMGKNEGDRRNVNCKVWDCSKALKAVKTSDWLDVDAEAELMNYNNNRIQLSKQHSWLPEQRVNLNCYMYNLTAIMKKTCPNLMSTWTNAVAEIRHKALLESRWYDV